MFQAFEISENSSTLTQTKIEDFSVTSIYREIKPTGALQTTPVLMATYKKADIETLLNAGNWEGIRLLIGNYDKELLIGAYGVNFSSNNSSFKIGTNDCLIGREDPDKAAFMSSNDFSPASPNQLASFELRKAAFHRGFLEEILMNSDVIRFNLIQLTFLDDGQSFQTMAARGIKDGKENTDIIASRLPCPPHCGGNDPIYGR